MRRSTSRCTGASSMLPAARRSGRRTGRSRTTASFGRASWRCSSTRCCSSTPTTSPIARCATRRSTGSNGRSSTVDAAKGAIEPPARSHFACTVALVSPRHRRSRGTVAPTPATRRPAAVTDRPIEPDQTLSEAELRAMDVELLNELEPEAGRLYDRHAKVAQEWFPHDFIPYRLGRDFDKEPWTPDQPRLTGVAQTAFEIGLLTEDNLPSYHRLIHGMFGKGDGAWINWVGRWTAEEGRHAIVLRDYLTVTRNIDPVLLERGRMRQLQQGYDHEGTTTLRGLAYVAFQELATRISHKNTGRYSDDPVADRIMVRIAADENLHMVFYRDILAAALRIQPSAAVRAIVDEVLAFEMPGAGIPGFLRKAASIAKAGIYDMRVHRDEVLLPILRHWGIFELEGLDAAAEDARKRLAEHLEALDASARRFEEKLATSSVRRLDTAG